MRRDARAEDALKAAATTDRKCSRLESASLMTAARGGVLGGYSPPRTNS